MGVLLKYAIKNKKGQYAGEGTVICCQMQDGDKVEGTIKSVTSCSRINLKDGRAIYIGNIMDFSIKDM